ncbi:MOS1T transposase, partial [Pseudoatta argentina]
MSGRPRTTSFAEGNKQPANPPLGGMKISSKYHNLTSATMRMYASGCSRGSEEVSEEKVDGKIEAIAFFMLTLRFMHPEKRPLYAQRHDKVILLHDNARPHVAKPVKTYLETLKWEVLPHPPYSPDIAPSDFHLFRSMAHGLADRRFHSYEEAQKWIDSWIASKDMSFFRRGIHVLPERWEKKSAAEAHRILVQTYGDNALSDTTCRDWFRSFKNNDFELEDKERSGAPKKFQDKELEQLLDEDPSQTLPELGKILQVGESTVSKRLKGLGMIQKQGHWVPRALKEKRPLYAQRHDKVILLHDNARPHVAKPVKTYLETLKWEV